MRPTLSEQSHPRVFREFTYVYPVLSRRSGGVSVGINLNPDKACNFDCIYCQVDRTQTPQQIFVAIPKLLEELESVLRGLAPGGSYWSAPEFVALPPEKQRVADVAFSGDGEPTTFRNFSEIVRCCVELKERLGFVDAKLVLITNATGLDRPDVRAALALMDQHRGEVWAKLDAGSPEYFARIDRTEFPFPKILDNIAACAQARETVIQSCFMRLGGQGPSFEEISQYVARLRDIVARGGRIKLVQVYTVARRPAESLVSSLDAATVDAIAERVRREAQLPAKAFYGDVPEGLGHK
ncbi:MAG TPA: radical SAM protein [Planctomycetota bacterium]|jgi:wyosine [tRNA(Phe)-imidazoG37] synthetase (radical SAM superfamily)